MNKHVELVKKWLADPESVTLKELEDNKKDAWSAADAANDAYWANYRAAYSADDATYWKNKATKHVKQYEELNK